MYGKSSIIPPPSSAITIPENLKTPNEEDNKEFFTETNNNNNSKLKWKIWGPYYFLSLFTFQLFPNSQQSKIINYLSWFPTILFMLIYFIRKIYLLVEMASAITLSTNFAYTTILFFTAMHTFFSAMTLGNFKRTKYFETTMDKLRRASSSTHEIKKASMYELLVQIIIFGIFLGCAILSIIENYVMFDHDVTDLNNRVPSVPKNETWTFRESMFGSSGGNNTLYFIDASLIIWGSYLSSCALVTYLMANRAVCREYQSFNENLKNQLENGAIKNYSTMKDLENQLIDLLNAASFTTNTASILIDLTFICGLYTHIVALFSLQSFKNSFHFIQLALFGLWYLQSIIMLVVSLKRPSALRTLMRETTEMIWLDRNIWDSKDDSSIAKIAQNISNRIQSTDYASKAMAPLKAASIIMTLILLFTPFFINVLSNFKYIPSYQQQ